MNDPVSLRRNLREVMAMGPKRKWRERVIFDGLRRITRDPLETDEFQQALQWNAAKGYITSEADEDSAMPGEAAPLLWSLTQSGLQKEGLA